MTLTLFNRQLPGGGRMVPTGPVRLIQGHPLAQQLLYLVIPSLGLVDLSGNQPPPIPFNGPPIAGSAAGPAISFNGTTQWCQMPGSSIFGTSDLIIAGLFTPANTATTGSQCFIIGEDYTTGGGWGQSIYLKSGAWYAYCVTSSPIVGIFASGGSPANGKQDFVVSDFRQSAATITLDVNGVQIAQTTTNGSGRRNNGYSTFGAGANAAPPEEQFAGTIGALWAFSTLTPALKSELAAAPFAMLESAVPMGAFWWVGGSGPTYLTFAVASLRMATQPLGVNAETALPIAERSITLTPRPLGVNAETSLTIAERSITMTPRPLGVNAETSLTTALARITMGTQPLGVNAETQMPIAAVALRLVARPLSVVASVGVTIARVTLRVAAYPFAGFGNTATGGIVRGIVTGILRGIVRR